MRAKFRSRLSGLFEYEGEHGNLHCNDVNLQPEAIGKQGL